MTKIFFSAILVLTLFSCGHSQSTSDKEKQRLNIVCDNFMKLFVENKAKEALELLKKNTVLTNSSIDTLLVTITQQKENVFSQFGTMLSSEYIKEKTVKDFIAKRFYIIKFTKFFLKVDFTLYNNGSGWTITSFHYNEDVDELLDYRLN